MAETESSKKNFWSSIFKIAKMPYSCDLEPREQDGEKIFKFGPTNFEIWMIFGHFKKNLGPNQKTLLSRRSDTPRSI